MRYDRDPSRDDDMHQKRETDLDETPVYHVFDSWAETWRQESRYNNGDLDNHLPDDPRRQMYEDAKERIESCDITDPDWEELLAPYSHEQDIMDITGHFVSAVQDYQDQDTHQFSISHETPVGGLGSYLDGDTVLQIDCQARLPGWHFDGILVNDGYVDAIEGLLGDEMTYINRGSTGELPETGDYDVINTGTIKEHFSVPHKTLFINYGETDRIFPLPHPYPDQKAESELPHRILNQGSFEDGKAASSDAFRPDGELRELLQTMEPLLQAGADQIHDAIEQWNQQYHEDWPLNQPGGGPDAV